MNINQIHYFLAIVRTKSFSEAAYDLFISQSSISKQIKSLEEELGIKLFTRTSNQRVLTPAGQIFYRYAKNMYDLHKDMLSEIDQLKNNIVNTIRIANIPIIPMYRNFNIGANLAIFQDQHRDEQIKFETYEASQTDILRDLYNGFTDFAVVREERIPNPSDFDIRLCSADRLVVVCRKDHPLTHNGKPTVSLDELTNYQIMMLGKESELRMPIIDMFAQHGLKIKEHGESLRPRIIQGLLTVGDTVSILPDNIVDLQTFDQLTTLPMSVDITSRAVLVRLKNNNHSKLLQEFWNYWQD